MPSEDVHVILSSAEKKLRFLMKTFQDFSPYNALQWELGTKRFKVQKTLSVQTVQRALNDSRL